VKRRAAALVLAAGASVLLAVMAVFATELSNTQAKSKADVRARVHERGVLAAALIDSLFQTVGQQVPQDQKRYGARAVTDTAMNAARVQAGQSDFLVLLDASGNVIAKSAGFTPQARAELPGSAALALARSGFARAQAAHVPTPAAYGLGDVLPYGHRGTIDLAVSFPTAYGTRTLVTGFAPTGLTTFIGGELAKIPGVKGAHNYLIDSRGTVIGSTNPAIKPGSTFSTPAEVSARAKSSGEIQGHYYAQVQIASSTWKLVLAAPDGPLFASVSGIRKWVAWLILAAFALVALVALLLSQRVIRAADDVHSANDRLAALNVELADTNAALERRAAELARSNAELEQFASIASHDLQEPLRKVRTFTEHVAIKEGENLSEKGRDYLERANSAAERMQRLMEDLLKFSRVSTHGRPFTPVDLAEVTRGVLDDLGAQVHESGAQVHVGALPTINGDALQMRQMMQNLISNALKFRRDGVAPEVSVDSAVADGVATISVRDNGIGFDPQYSRRIFRVFERLHGRHAYPGTGIGLALCRKIAERHGGTIVADAMPGAGATLTVTLPVDQHEEVLSSGFQSNGGGPSTKETHVAA
jgi:signal transduction histidine kinase